MGTVTLRVASGPISHSGAEARPQANGTHVSGGGGGPRPSVPLGGLRLLMQPGPVGCERSLKAAQLDKLLIQVHLPPRGALKTSTT